MFNLTKISLAIALLGGSGVAQAQLTTTSSLNDFSGSASVTAVGASVASATNSNNNAAIATVGLGQFDGAMGVLVGADIQLISDRQQSISGVGSKNNGPGRVANGSGKSTAGLSAPGASSTFNTPATLAGSGCDLASGPTGSISCNWGPVTSAVTATNASIGVDAANLDNYVGAGAVDVELTLPSLQATSTLSRTQGQSSSSTSTYSVNWTGSLQASYSYLLHAEASFDSAASVRSLTLDFGSVALGSSASPLSFSLFNLADANRVGVDLDSISGTGNTSQMRTNLATFLDLAQGDSTAFSAWLDTSTVGSFNARYLLNFSDADVGASATRANSQLEINLVGNVVAVPEPETYAMLLAGLGLVGATVRRRKPSTACSH